jgi:hypothetical protein
MSLNKRIIIIILVLATILISIAIGYSIGLDTGIPAMKPARAISAIKSKTIEPSFVFHDDQVCLEFGSNQFQCWDESSGIEARTVLNKETQVCIYNIDLTDFYCYNKYPQTF